MTIWIPIIIKTNQLFVVLRPTSIFPKISLKLIHNFLSVLQQTKTQKNRSENIPTLLSNRSHY